LSIDRLSSARHSGCGAFPDDFRWGCATASYQIEGSPKADGKGPSIWDAFCQEPGRILFGETGDVACDSYRRWPDDLALIKELGVRAYRFSVAWPRIQPDGNGKALEKGIAFYSRMADDLLAAGVEPWVTLYHWDLPLALGSAGGWTNRDTAYRFADYSAIMFKALGDRVKHWFTLNEPWCSAFLGYRSGEQAPGHRNEAEAYAAVHNLLLAHGLARDAFKAAGAPGQIGIVINPSAPRPATGRADDIEAARRASVEQTGLWLDPIFGRGYPQEYIAAHNALLPVKAGDMDIIAGPLDFIGVNYYSECAVEAVPASAACPDGYREVASFHQRTEMGWEIAPQGLRRILNFINDTWKPRALYVTENGAAFADRRGPDGRIHDADRIGYLRRHIGAAADALADGVPLKGYFLWSLLDNFEWSNGYTKKFGIAAIDPETGDRIKKDSFYYYRDAAAGFPE